ncbi:MAG: hypothetical protein AAFW95_10540, partial [Cyanobacteria bacterium J06638_6]
PKGWLAQTTPLPPLWSLSHHSAEPIGQLLGLWSPTLGMDAPTWADRPPAAAKTRARCHRRTTAVSIA